MRALAEILFPPRCVSCRAPASWLCRACEAGFPKPGPACARCAEPAVVAVRECVRCTRDPPPFVATFAAARYTDVARDALMAFKLGGERRAARAMAARMVDAAGDVRADVVTFVPSGAAALRERGFNPAEELARAVSKEMRVPCRPLLRKVADTADQSGLSRAERARNVAAAFAPLARRTARRQAQVEARESQPGGLAVVLVDDVMTTGATARACAGALSAMGQIAILTFARAG